MKAKDVRDPNGARLTPIMLQVVDDDAQGPLLLRFVRDHETINLAPENVAGPQKFVIVWGGEGVWLGEMRMSDLIVDFAEVREALTQGNADLLEVKRGLEAVRREYDALEADNKVKTEELRRLQRERDPERFDKAVKEAVAEATAEHEKTIAFYMNERTDMQRELDELRASKKRLKEANERLKEGRR